ncbi:hypothetical protein TVAG_162750 [Trichomonas vaginalis G3]|uniref:Uncharacterized protein n=1 Tax=Trichomonas vaginalis (strain ATCC PRA-98 / G3) TaxID=412133 RepID=A2FV23_TRIV3|nr:ATPase activity, coupled to transmembrane movement of substances [Trichomonas vaginalis G3]EAX91253.1 hypothetical protein TVAG_162750 [Trichomonas vaginalis G3]KAI5509101.1 ATPase activity, coupled to transmembrane movement of substances [Trichomonas vaginalis G3]|eukprot:XP_001304183.1 hypothetical protein [Trichomonas vaginalis G3]
MFSRDQIPPIDNLVSNPAEPSTVNVDGNIPRRSSIVSMAILGTEALRASIHHLAVLTLYETVNIYFTTQTTTLT